MTSIVVRDALPADAARIGEVARASWTDTYAAIFEPAFIEEFLAEAYDAEALAHAAQDARADADRHFLVAERDGRVIAYAQFGRGPRGPELWRIYADPAHYGTGAGAALLSELHRRIADSVDSYVLDVHSRNERGRRFYDQNGFVIVGGGATPDCDLTLERRMHPRRVELPIRLERLVVRALRDDDRDLERLHAIYGDPETMRFVGASGRPLPDRDATWRVLRHLLQHDDLHGFSLWALDEIDGEPLVGIAGLAWVEGHGPDVEAAYLLRRDRWGRGYATEALRAVLTVGHEQLGIERIVALAYPDNAASQHVMIKAGMRPDGTHHAYGRELARHISPA